MPNLATSVELDGHPTSSHTNPYEKQACRAIGSWAGFSLVRVRLWVESQATCSLAFTLALNVSQVLAVCQQQHRPTYLTTLFSSTTFYQSTTPHLASHRRAHSTRAQRIATAPRGDPQAAHGKQVGIGTTPFPTHIHLHPPSIHPSSITFSLTVLPVNIHLRFSQRWWSSLSHYPPFHRLLVTFSSPLAFPRHTANAREPSTHQHISACMLCLRSPAQAFY